MTQFEGKLQVSAQRLAEKENKNMHVPKSPMHQNRTYWGWVATPAAAVVGIVLGMSMHLFVGNKQQTADTSMVKGQWPMVNKKDTIRIIQPIHDTLYLTRVVEKEKVVKQYIPMPEEAKAVTKEPTTQPQECTSIQCDGINYAFLASK